MRRPHARAQHNPPFALQLGETARNGGGWVDFDANVRVVDRWATILAFLMGAPLNKSISRGIPEWQGPLPASNSESAAWVARFAAGSERRRVAVGGTLHTWFAALMGTRAIDFIPAPLQATTPSSRPTAAKAATAAATCAGECAALS